MLSMGNTGALLAAGLLIVGRIKGVKRPAIATLLPTKEGPKMLTDAGANTHCKPENLVQFAIMSEIYMRKIMGIERPRIALLSNGEEEGKGNDLVKETFPLMKQQDFNYIGNAEGRDIMYGNADVRQLMREQEFICLPHYDLLQSLAPQYLQKQELDSFVKLCGELTEKYVLTLYEDVSKYCSMYDYRNTGKDADWGNSKDSIERAIGFLTSRKP